jgi:RNA polymerase sigma factor (sigma-70 family)
VDEALDDTGDAALIAAVRGGRADAYGELYQRHLAAARRAAGSLAGSVAEREDLIAEAFMLVLRALRNGRGPVMEFRPYLLVTIRNVAISSSRRAIPVAMYELPERLLADAVVDDPVTARLHAELAAEAFVRLPERWRKVLWRTEIEGESPAAIADQLGLTANGVSALACRAREGLRQAYLELHLPDQRKGACRTTRSQLAAWVRRGMPHGSMKRITKHIDRCAGCRAEAADLAEINYELCPVIAPQFSAYPGSSRLAATRRAL